ncbi:endolytic transglycosylase MltG [Nocardia tengchongensis]|uniref:endolytic transglycosylase MltG n=1 Tax=Nocardia tengchongensis TaxID=2055889 RepID=UPI0036B03EDD
MITLTMLFGGQQPGPPADYTAGSSGSPVVVWIPPNATMRAIGDILAKADVVASSAAFDQAAKSYPALSSLPSGYYEVPSRSSGLGAAETLSGNARVGNVVISPGQQLLDVTYETSGAGQDQARDVTHGGTGAVKRGIYHQIAAASCIYGIIVRCVTYDELVIAGAFTDPVDLGVPAWAVDQVRSAPDRERRLEGLIGAGSWDFDPTASPVQIIRQLVTASTTSYEKAGLLQSSATNGLTPYETVVAVSLVERESLPQDMPKVARVILNRLKAGQPLQLDSAFSYWLDINEDATATVTDRTHPNPWNTYAVTGLPATPVAAATPQALRAMENPTPGNWLYFVTIDTEGATLFTDDYTEYLRDIDKAHQSGMNQVN